MEKDWFGEKTAQVHPDFVVAFGIELASRRGNAGELINMLEFATAAALAGMAGAVEKVYCDSKVGLYEVTLVEPAPASGGVVDQALFVIASKHLGHILWRGDEHIAGPDDES